MKVSKLNILGWIATGGGIAQLFGLDFDVKAIQEAFLNFWDAGALLWGLIFGPLVIWFRAITSVPLVSGFVNKLLGVKDQRSNKFRTTNLMIFLVIPFLVFGCKSTGEYKEDRVEVQQKCDQGSILIECRIAEAWLTLAAITEGVTDALNKDLIKVDKAQEYRDKLPAIESALKAAEAANTVRREDTAVAKLGKALEFIKDWEQFKPKDE